MICGESHPSGASGGVLSADGDARGAAAASLPGAGLAALHVWTFYVLAFVQPLFGVVAESPTFFVAHRAGAAEILTVAVVLCLVLPLPLLGLIALASRWLPRLGFALVLGSLALLTGLMVLTEARRWSDLPWPLLVLAAAIAGAVAAFGYRRFALLRSFATACSVAIVVVPAAFLGFSPVSGLLLSSQSPRQVVEVDSEVPVVYVIFDELPLVSLLDQDLSIDEVRFPNIAELAGRSTWYRNATSVAVATQNAVPAMLTGRRPRTQDGRDVTPRVEELPENLFTLLSGSYDLHVLESMTALCPEDTRGCRAEEGFWKRQRDLARDLAMLQAHVLLPAVFTRELPDVTARWRDFSRSEDSPEPAADPQSSPEPPTREPTPLEVALEFAGERWRDHSKTGRAHHYELFLQSLRSASRSLFFVHCVLPHRPFEYLPSGHRYRMIGGVPGLDGRGRWLSEEAALQAQQRHLLQLAYVDRLVGDLLARLEAVGLYDDALLIVGSDHGASFRGAGWTRELSLDNRAEVLAVPLFVKYPGQRQGKVDARNVETVDILPTIADVLGIDLPWQADGRSVQGPVDRTRAEKQVLTFDMDTGVFDTLSYALPRETLREAVVLQIARFGSGLPPNALFGIGRFRFLLRTAVDDWAVEPAAHFVTTLARADALQRVDPEAVLPLVQGTIEPVPEAREIAVSVNGVIHNVTRIQPDGVFTAPLPVEAFVKGANEIEILLLSGSPESPLLLRTARKP